MAPERWTARQSSDALRCPAGHPLSRDVRLVGAGAIRCRHRPNTPSYPGRGLPCGLWLLVVPTADTAVVMTLAATAGEVDVFIAAGGRLSSLP